MRKYIVILNLVVPILLMGQYSYEEIAFEYFVKNILKEFEYKKVFYSDRIDDRKSGSVYITCFNDYMEKYPYISENNRLKLDSIRQTYWSNSSNDIRMNTQVNNLFLDRKNTKKINKIIVRKANAYIPDYFFVEIVIFEKNKQIQVSVEIDTLTMYVSRWCKSVVVY
jgi:hypothetical protein